MGILAAGHYDKCHELAECLRSESIKLIGPETICLQIIFNVSLNHTLGIMIRLIDRIASFSKITVTLEKEGKHEIELRCGRKFWSMGNGLR